MLITLDPKFRFVIKFFEFERQFDSKTQQEAVAIDLLLGYEGPKPTWWGKGVYELHTVTCVTDDGQKFIEAGSPENSVVFFKDPSSEQFSSSSEEFRTSGYLVVPGLKKSMRVTKIEMVYKIGNVGLVQVDVPIPAKQQVMRQRYNNETTTPVPQKHTGKPRNNIVRVGLVSILVGVAFFYWGFVHRFWRINQVRHWTPTPCVITDSRADVVHYTAEPSIRSKTGRSEWWSHTMEVEYSFQANNQTYYGDTYSFGASSESSRSPNKSLVRSIVISLPPGTKTTCFYDPADPTQSVLNRSVPSHPWAAIPGLIFVLIGLGFLILNFAMHKHFARPTGKRL